MYVLYNEFKGGLFMLTKTEEKVYTTIKDLVDKNGYSPSIREICTSTGIKSTSTVSDYLNRLEKKGLINRNKFSPRTISLKNT
jgi:repressor LexA